MEISWLHDGSRTHVRDVTELLDLLERHAHEEGRPVLGEILGDSNWGLVVGSDGIRATALLFSPDGRSWHTLDASAFARLGESMVPVKSVEPTDTWPVYCFVPRSNVEMAITRFLSNPDTVVDDGWESE